MDQTVAESTEAVPNDAHFYFDVREGALSERDEIGFECSDIDAAECEAAKTAAEIGRDRLPNGKAREIAIDVHDAGRKKILTVAVTLRVERH